MANYFILGIGGTGSRVIRSLTMLLGAGFKPFKATDNVFPLLIDYDTTNGDTLRTKKLIDTYHKVHNAAYPMGVRDEERFNNLFFSTPLLEMKEVSSAYSSEFAMKFGAESKQTFEQWTAAGQLTKSKSHTADLLNSLYDDSSDDNNAELKLNMEVGFKGNPNIGSIVFHSLKETKEFQDFASLCQKGDKVIIVGSLFGGTGSSGIPELVQAIRTHNKPDVASVDLSVLMVCPYFGFKTSDEKAVRSSIFNSKTKAALNFYKTSGINDKINAIYYIGDRKTSTYTYSEGGETQLNNSHVVDLIGALAICHFAETNQQPYDSENKVVAGTGTKYYKYRMTELDDSEKVQDDEEADQSYVNGLNFTNFIDKELEHTFYPLASFALALRFFHDEVAKHTDIVNSLDWYTTLGIASCFEKGRAITADTNDEKINELRRCCSGLMDFYDLFTAWNEELKKHSSHALYLFNFDPQKHLAEFIVEGSLKGQGRNMIGLKTTEYYIDMEDDVAEGTKNAWNKLKAVNTFGVDSKYRAFMLMSVLTNGCREVFMSTNSRTETRRKVLSAKTIKVNVNPGDTNTPNS